MMMQWRKSATWPMRVGQPAVVEHLQEQVPDRGVRLLELVEQHHGERLLAHAVDERVVSVASPLPRILCVVSAVWNSLMSRRIMRSTEPNRYSATVLASSVLPVPVGPANRNTPIGLPGSLRPGLEHGDAVDDGADRLVLADDAARRSSSRIGGEIDALLVVEDRDRQAGELRQRHDHVVRRDRCAAGLERRG